MTVDTNKDGMTNKDIENKISVLPTIQSKVNYLSKLEKKIHLTRQKTQSSFYDVLGGLYVSNGDFNNAANIYKERDNTRTLTTIADQILEEDGDYFTARDVFDNIDDEHSRKLALERAKSRAIENKDYFGSITACKTLEDYESLQEVARNAFDDQEYEWARIAFKQLDNNDMVKKTLQLEAEQAIDKGNYSRAISCYTDLGASKKLVELADELIEESPILNDHAASALENAGVERPWKKVGDKAFDNGDYAAALQAYRHDSTVNEDIMFADKAAKEGFHISAAEHYDLGGMKNSAQEMWIKGGKSCLETGYFENAYMAFKRAGNIEGLIDVGVTSYENGLYDIAFSAFNTVGASKIKDQTQLKKFMESAINTGHEEYAIPLSKRLKP